MSNQLDVSADASKPTRTRYFMLFLVCVLTALNYLDRSNLSVGATDIQREMHISNLQLGFLLSAFFWTYALSQLCGFAGWLAENWERFEGDDLAVLTSVGATLWREGFAQRQK